MIPPPPLSLSSKHTSLSPPYISRISTFNVIATANWTAILQSISRFIICTDLESCYYSSSRFGLGSSDCYEDGDTDVSSLTARLRRASRTDSWDSGESRRQSMDINGLTEWESWCRHRCEIFVR
ncbi:hypothetical protein ACFX2J_022918 [Malus domestica]